MAGRTIVVKLELTPTGRAIIRFAQVVAAADRAMLPDDVLEAARDVLALIEEQHDE